MRKFFLFTAFAFAFFSCSDTSEEETYDKDFKQEMRDFVIGICKGTNHGRVLYTNK